MATLTVTWNVGNITTPPPLQPKREGILWDSTAFLTWYQGRDATPAERVSLSRALNNLDKRGLIKRTRSRGKRRRTSHIKLTEAGIKALPVVFDDLKSVNK